MAWNSLGLALREAGRFDEAVAAHSHAGELFVEVADRQGEALAWLNLGLALASGRRMDEAITASERALAAYRETGDHRGAGHSGEVLAMLWTHFGDTRRARDARADAEADYLVAGADDDARRVRSKNT
jgi:tetratricopeptide (TPR) repeat protein